MKELLTSLATAVLRHFIGGGSWVKYSDQNRGVKPCSNPLPGLTVGDTVFFLAEDTSQIESEVVCFVTSTGVGFSCCETDDGRVVLQAIDREIHSASLKLFLDEHPDLVARELAMLRNYADQLQQLEAKIASADC